MNIELIDKKRVLFDLCNDDMKLLSIKYKEFNLKSSENVWIIKNLINIARERTGFYAPKNSSLFVEAMPYDGGCFILITIKGKKLNGKKFKVLKKPFKIMFSFKNCENMLCAIERVYRDSPSNFKSSIVLYEDCYYLLITSNTKVRNTAITTFREYSENSFSNSLKIAHIIEFGKTILKDNAIKIAGGAMCNI